MVDPDEPERIVGTGDGPRAVNEPDARFFMPRFLERDEAEREPPGDLYPWDGVRKSALLATTATVFEESTTKSSQ